MIELKTNRPIYLYAMGYYEVKNIIDDLSIIISKLATHSLDTVKESDIISLLLGLVHKHFQENNLAETNFLNFVGHLDPENKWLNDFWSNYSNDDDSFNTLVVLSCLSALAQYGANIIHSSELLYILPVKPDDK